MNNALPGNYRQRQACTIFALAMITQKKAQALRLFIAAFFVAACFPALLLAQQTLPFNTAKPPDVPVQWKPLIGSYVGADGIIFEVLENNGHLELQRGTEPAVPLREESEMEFYFVAEHQAPVALRFLSGPRGTIEELDLGSLHLQRRNYTDPRKSFRVVPQRPLDELRKEALAASPPKEEHAVRKPELVEVATLDQSIHLDIRYATANNFLGTPVYTQAHAFLQRPAAEAVVRAQAALKHFGYGLLIHDGYRPWYVTKIFWDATPQEGKIFVADPSQGSRHNRGCAVDLTLYDLKTGAPIEMPGTYDEMSPRSFPNYPGGTSLERWHRELLRHAMEAQGFTVFDAEWWHFDYKDWKEYPILNVPFEQLEKPKVAATAFSPQ
jgi:D-alanyl-D-alanine dipeptidase